MANAAPRGGNTVTQTYVTHETSDTDPRLVPGFYSNRDHQTCNHSEDAAMHHHALNESEEGSGGRVPSTTSSGRQRRKRYTTTTVTTVTTTTLLVPKTQGAVIFPSETVHAIENPKSGNGDVTESSIDARNDLLLPLTAKTSQTTSTTVTPPAAWAFQQTSQKAVEQLHTAQQPKLLELGIPSYFSRCPSASPSHSSNAFYRNSNYSGDPPDEAPTLGGGSSNNPMRSAATV